MTKLGGYALIFGIGSFLLPIFGLQFTLISALGLDNPVASLVISIIGILLLLLGRTTVASEASEI